MMRFIQFRKYILAFRKKKNNNKNGSTVRLMFFDFSSALKTIQPHLFVQKLKNETTVIRYFMDL